MTSELRALARKHGPGAVAALVVIAIAAKTIFGRIGTFDLGFDDEGWILGIGVGLPTPHLPPAEYGPLYALWYRAIAAIQPDPVALYTFNWWVLQLGLVALLYAVARRSGAPRIAAGIVTLAWSLSHAVVIWPFNVYFSTTILAAGALACTFTTDRLFAATVLTIATAVASFVRPELAIPGFALLAVVVVWSIARAVRARRPRALTGPAAIAATIVALVTIFGSPLGGGRSYFAFEQHYAWHRVEAGQLDVDPMTAFEPIVRADFPHAASIAGAAFENPSAFAWHLGYNLRLLGRRLGWFWETDPYVPRGIEVTVTAAFVIVLALGSYAIARRRKTLSPQLVAWLPIWVPVGASFVAAVVLIHPRDHYLVPFSFFGSAMFAAACGAVRWQPEGRFARAAEPVAFAAAVVLLAALPTYKRDVLPSIADARGNPPPTEWHGRNDVEALRALALSGERVILEPELSRAVYARMPFRWVAAGEKDRPFFDFLRERQVDLVIITQRMRDDARYRDDPEFQAFVADDGDKRGFVFRWVPRSATVIAFLPK